MRVRVEQGERAELRWKLVHGETSPALGVTRLVGYDERAPGGFERTELPTASLVLIVELGPPLDVDGLETTAGRPRSGGFVAGHQPGPVRTAHHGHQEGIQVDLPASRARQLLGVSPAELRGRVLSLADVAGEFACFADRLASLGSWPERMDLLEVWLGRRLAEGPPPDPRIVYAERVLLESQGRAPLRLLQAEVGLGERRFERLFESTVGVPPKRFARLARFDHVRALMRQSSDKPLVDIALETGHFDQAHLAREVRALAGTTPAALRRSLGG